MNNVLYIYILGSYVLVHLNSCMVSFFVPHLSGEGC